MSGPDWRQVIGKQVTRDIFNKNGVLLLPNSTIINDEHLRTLIKHNILLNKEDVTSIGPYSNLSTEHQNILIDEAVETSRQMFEEIKYTRKIPIADIRQDVIPMIQEAVKGRHLFNLFASLQAKDDYTYRHNIAVAAISTLIGTWMKLEHQELLQLTTAALLHDIGKMFIPQEILNKPGKLTEEEFAIMKKHTILGYDVIKNSVGISQRQALVALQHHERMDGSGYPLGLSKDKLDLFSRIVSVADVFHAMSSKRVYRHPSPFYEVLSQMEKNAFGALDPEITRMFITKIMDSLIGNKVLFTDGKEGKIIMVYQQEPTQPLVQIDGQFIKLGKNSSVQIEQILEDSSSS